MQNPKMLAGGIGVGKRQGEHDNNNIEGGGNNQKTKIFANDNSNGKNEDNDDDENTEKEDDEIINVGAHDEIETTPTRLIRQPNAHHGGGVGVGERNDTDEEFYDGNYNIHNKSKLLHMMPLSRRYRHLHRHHRHHQRYAEDEEQKNAPNVTLTHNEQTTVIKSNDNDDNETAINLKQRPSSSLGQTCVAETTFSPTSSNASTTSLQQTQRHSLEYAHHHAHYAAAHHLQHHHRHLQEQHQQELQHHQQHQQQLQHQHAQLQHSYAQQHQHQQQQHHHQHLLSASQHNTAAGPSSPSSSSTSSTSAAAAAAAAAAANRRDNNIDYSTLFVQLSGTLPTLYRCVSCNKIVSNRWHHANIHRPQSHECPVCGQKFTRRDNMKAHCKIKHADMKDLFFGHYVHM